MAVRIRMKKFGKTHRPFFRICAMDGRAPRNGKVIEELGYYDPMVRDTDARAVLNGERIDYWLSVGAQPSDNVKVLVKKYGTNGTHLDKQKEALERLSQKQAIVPTPVPKPKEEEPAAEEPAAEQPAAEEQATTTAEAEPATEEAAATQEDSAGESSAEESPAEEDK